MNKWALSLCLQASIAELASTAATDVGMHGLLASQSCYQNILCYILVCVHCWPVVDLNRHPYILLISLEIFFLYFMNIIITVWMKLFIFTTSWPTHAQ